MNQGPYELPVGWAWAKLGDVVINHKQGYYTKKKYTDKGTRVARITDIDDRGELHYESMPFLQISEDEAKRFRVSRSDFLFARSGSIGRVALVRRDSPCIFGSYLIRFRFADSATSEDYLLYFFQSDFFRNQLLENKHGIANLNVNAKDIKSVMIPIPPCPEQSRIAAKIEMLLEENHDTRKALDRILSLLRKFNESVLGKALRGELLEQSQEYESASALLEYAEEEQRDLSERKAGEYGIEEPKPEGAIEFGELPVGWCWTRLENVVDINRESRNPAKDEPNKKFYYVDISSIEGGTGEFKEVRSILGRNAPSRARRVIHTGDVLLSTVRPYLRSFAIVPPEYDNAICSTGFAVLSCRNVILPEYLLKTLFSNLVIEQCSMMTVGTHYPALNVAHVRQIRIPLPPIPEQHRIIARIDELTENAEDVMRTVESVRKETDRIDQGILSKGLRGELEPQDPHDEPAELMLDRIIMNRSDGSQSMREPEPY